MKSSWSSITWPTSSSALPDPDTGVDLDTLRELGKASVKVPEGFVVHDKVGRFVKARLGALEGKGVDWATAEVCINDSLSFVYLVFHLLVYTHRLSHSLL